MDKRLEVLLEMLGFASKRDAQVKDLTGGEVKRVSIGIGLISNPVTML
jgi:ABC-type branched-subunit amino acid transport system ATPase component